MMVIMCVCFVIIVVVFGCCVFFFCCFFFQAEDGIRDLVRSRGLGDVYKRQVPVHIQAELSSSNWEDSDWKSQTGNGSGQLCLS